MQAQPLLDHGARAAADERVQLLGRDRCQADQAEHVVGRGRQVGRRIDQRAVEIEDDGRVREIAGMGNGVA